MSALGGKRAFAGTARARQLHWSEMALLRKTLPAAVALLALVAATALAGAANGLSEAPLPSGVSPSHDEKVRGLYAESTYYGRTDVIAEVARLEEDCTAHGTTAQIDGRDALWRGQRRLYRSRTAIADYADTPTIRVDSASCKALVTLARSVEVMPATPENLQKVGWLDEIPPCSTGRFRRRCRDDIVAQVEARCIDLGDGFVGSVLCYSTQNDLSRNLELGGSSYTDDGSVPDNSWGFRLVLPDTLIDPAVFREADAHPN